MTWVRVPPAQRNWRPYQVTKSGDNTERRIQGEPCPKAGEFDLQSDCVEFDSLAFHKNDREADKE